MRFQQLKGPVHGTGLLLAFSPTAYNDIYQYSNNTLYKSLIFPGAMAKALINQSRQNVARMVGGKAEDIIFTSGGTEVTTALFWYEKWQQQRNCSL